MAAGLGFKTFTTGEVLTAADVNGYLMQGILVFATEAARNSAITAPQEGQFAFTKDNNSLWYYTGSAWVASGATGDIEGVTAGVGISGGGTSGTVTITNDMATTITASGDIVVGTGSGTYDNLPIGSTGQVLTADTTVSPYKVKWSAPSSGGFVFLNKTSFTTVTSQAVDNIFSSTYDNYLIVVNITQSSLNDIQYVWRTSVPADVTGNYYDNQAGYQSTSAAFDFTAGGATNGTLLRLSGGDGGMVHFVVTDVAAAAMTNINGTANGVKTNNYFGAAISSKHVVQTAYAGIKLLVPTGNMSGSITIYGLVKA